VTPSETGVNINISVNYDSEKFLKRTATSSKLIIAVYSRLGWYFLYMFVKQARVQFPNCWIRGLGCEGQWAKNLTVLRWMIKMMGPTFRMQYRWTVGVRVGWL